MKKLKNFGDFVNESKLKESESVDESLLLTLGLSIVGIWQLLQTFSVLLYHKNSKNFKDADLRYTELLSYWNPRAFIEAWQLVKKDNRILKLVNRLKDDDEIIEFLKNPKQKGWQKMLSSKLNSNEEDLLKDIYKRHFAKDGPQMNSWD